MKEDKVSWAYWDRDNHDYKYYNIAKSTLYLELQTSPRNSVIKFLNLNSKKVKRDTKHKYKFWKKHKPWLKVSVAAWSSEREKFFQEDLKWQNSPSRGEVRVGTISSLNLLLLLFRLLSFGVPFFRGGRGWQLAVGPFLNTRKKSRQGVVAFGCPSESEVLALGEVASDS
jgi:hypothetical protein